MESVYESPRQYIQQVESPRYITQQNLNPYAITSNTPNYPMSIIDFPDINSRNNIPYSSINIPNSPINTPNFPKNNPNVRSLVSECTPSVCKNLADTIQLMVLSDLLQKQDGGDEIALRMAAPLLSNLINPSSALRSNSVVPSRLVKSLPTVLASIPSVVPPTSNSRIVANVSPNIMTSVTSNERIERGLLTSLLKSLGAGV